MTTIFQRRVRRAARGWLWDLIVGTILFAVVYNVAWFFLSP
jgi:hypothetical protein